MLCDQREDAVQGQDPQHASLVQAAGEEVSQQQRVGQGRHDAGVQLHQHLLQKLGGQRQPQQPQPCVTAAELRFVKLCSCRVACAWAPPASEAERAEEATAVLKASL